MAAPKFKIDYLDGENAECKLLPGQQMAYESDTGEPLFDDKETPTMTKVYMLAWYAAGRPGEFTEWVNSLESVEMVSEETDDDRPTSQESLPD